MDLEELYQRYRRGDESALAQLVKLLEPVLHSMAKRLCQNSKARSIVNPSDLLQTAWMKLQQRKEMGELPDNLQAWLITVIRNDLLHFQKLHAVTHTQQDQRLANRQDAALDQPVDIVINAEFMEYVRCNMNPILYEPIIMHYIEGVAWMEVAEKHAPLKSAANLAKMCRLALKKCKEKFYNDIPR